MTEVFVFFLIVAALLAIVWYAKDRVNKPYTSLTDEGADGIISPAFFDGGSQVSSNSHTSHCDTSGHTSADGGGHHSGFDSGHFDGGSHH